MLIKRYFSLMSRTIRPNVLQHRRSHLEGPENAPKYAIRDKFSGDRPTVIIRTFIRQSRQHNIAGKMTDREREQSNGQTDTFRQTNMQAVEMSSSELHKSELML